MSGSYCLQYYVPDLETCFVLIMLFGWQAEKPYLEGIRHWCSCFTNVFCVVMRMLLGLWFVCCKLKFVAVKCDSTFCSDRSLFLVFYTVFYKEWNIVKSILNESYRY